MINDQPPSTKTHIMHLTTKLELSGTEAIILGLAKYHPDKHDRITVCSLTAKVPYIKRLKAEGLPVYVLGMPANNLWQVGCSLPVYLVKLFLLLKKEKVTILIMHSFLAGIMGRLAAVIARTPLVIRYIHNMELDLPSRIGVERFFKYITDYYLAVSKGVKKYAQKNAGLKDSQIEVIYVGVDQGVIDGIPKKLQQKRAELGFRKEDKIIGAVGRLTEQKGLIYAIRAMPRVLQKIPQAKLLVIGNGPLRNYLGQEVERLDLQSKAIFLGARNDILSIFPVFDIFVLPSLWEGFPVVLMEAMLKGIPVIASQIPGVDEMILPGKTGLLVTPKDHEMLADKIISLFKDTKQQEILIQESRANIERNYTAQQMAFKMSLVFQRKMSN
ncbi:MAG: glycosyltransferase [Elusimicrobia bacterium]|nr:glycosyltransferase [Elusimicrobiota bacterium]